MRLGDKCARAASGHPRLPGCLQNRRVVIQSDPAGLEFRLELHAALLIGSIHPWGALTSSMTSSCTPHTHLLKRDSEAKLARKNAGDRLVTWGGQPISHPAAKSRNEGPERRRVAAMHRACMFRCMLSGQTTVGYQPRDGNGEHSRRGRVRRYRRLKWA
jgi:hypothetical protein